MRGYLAKMMYMSDAREKYHGCKKIECSSRIPSTMPYGFAEVQFLLESHLQ